MSTAARSPSATRSAPPGPGCSPPWSTPCRTAAPVTACKPCAKPVVSPTPRSSNASEPPCLVGLPRQDAHGGVGHGGVPDWTGVQVVSAVEPRGEYVGVRRVGQPTFEVDDGVEFPGTANPGV